MNKCIRLAAFLSTGTLLCLLLAGCAAPVVKDPRLACMNDCGAALSACRIGCDPHTLFCLPGCDRDNTWCESNCPAELPKPAAQPAPQAEPKPQN